MALAGVAFAKATRRRQIMVATSSIGPGATNMVTAAAAAFANRLPPARPLRRHVPESHPGPRAPAGRTLRIALDDRQRRISSRDAVLGPNRQPGAGRPQPSARRRHDARPRRLRPGVRRTSAGCPGRGMGLPGRSVRAARSRAPPRATGPARARRSCRSRSRRAAPARDRGRRCPLLARRGRAPRLRRAHGLPVVETMAGKACLTADHPAWVGPVGVTGCDHEPPRAEADLVLAIGTRLQDFTTGSWTVFGEEARIVGLNAARSTRRSTVRSRSSRTRARACPSCRRRSPTGTSRRAGAIEPATSARPSARSSLRGPPRPRGRAPDVRTGRRGGQPAGGRGRSGAHCCWGPPRRDERQLAPEGRRDVRLRVRLLDDGVRDRRSLGSSDGPSEGEVIAFVGDGSYLMLNSSSTARFSPATSSSSCSATTAGMPSSTASRSARAVRRTGTCSRTFGRAIPLSTGWRTRSRSAASPKRSPTSRRSRRRSVGRAADRTTVLVVRTAPHDWTPGGAFWEVGAGGVRARRSPRHATGARGQAAPARRPVSAPIRSASSARADREPHARLVAHDVPGLELAAVYDVDQEAARAVGRAVDVDVAASAEDLLASPTTDAIAICTSTDTHGPRRGGVGDREACLRREADLLDLAATDRALTAVDRAKLFLQVGFNRRLDPAHASVRDAVAAGEVGELPLVRISSRDPGPRRSSTSASPVGSSST